MELVSHYVLNGILLHQVQLCLLSLLPQTIQAPVLILDMHHHFWVLFHSIDMAYTVHLSKVMFLSLQCYRSQILFFLTLMEDFLPLQLHSHGPIMTDCSLP